MSEGQLREAFALMKQGNKESAASLVQDVLREDRNNADAWWLLAHLLNDKAKVVKCLETVLNLEPEHQAAHKKLSELAPNSPGLFNLPALVIENWEKEEAFKLDSEDYWEKLDTLGTKEISMAGIIWESFAASFTTTSNQKPSFEDQMWFPQPRRQRSYNPAFFWVRLWIVTITSVFLIVFLANAYFRSSDRPSHLPIELAGDYVVAFYSEDEAALYTMICPEYRPVLDRLVSQFEGINTESIEVDISETIFVLTDYTVESALLEINGLIRIHYQGNTRTIDWREHLGTNGIFLRMIDGVWKVCLETN